jgi:hypothetical protein
MLQLPYWLMIATLLWSRALWQSLPAARKRTRLINYPISRLIHPASRCHLCRVSSTPRRHRMTHSHRRSKRA